MQRPSLLHRHHAASFVLALGMSAIGSLADSAASELAARHERGADALFDADPPGTFELPHIGPAADLELRDAATGRSLALSDLANRVVLLTFFYVRCPDGNACPMTTAILREVDRELAGREMSDQVALLSVTFDQQHDTEAVLREQRRALGASSSWYFARAGSEEKRAAMLAAYDQRIATRADGTITHPMRVFLIDPHRRVRQIYSQGYLRADVLLSDIETLLLEERRTNR